MRRSSTRPLISFEINYTKRTFTSIKTWAKVRFRALIAWRFQKQWLGTMKSKFWRKKVNLSIRNIYNNISRHNLSKNWQSMVQFLKKGKLKAVGGGRRMVKVIHDTVTDNNDLYWFLVSIPYKIGFVQFLTKMEKSKYRPDQFSHNCPTYKYNPQVLPLPLPSIQHSSIAQQHCISRGSCSPPNWIGLTHALTGRGLISPPPPLGFSWIAENFAWQFIHKFFVKLAKTTGGARVNTPTLLLGTQGLSSCSIFSSVSAFCTDLCISNGPITESKGILLLPI